MRELSRTLSKLAQLPAPPTTSAKSSGCVHKKLATVRATVRHFVGSDVVRALLDNDEYNTAYNIDQLQFLIDCIELAAELERSRVDCIELAAELELARAQAAAMR